MRPRAHLLGLVSVLGLVALAACTTDYQKGLEDPLFGAPNALADQRQPGPSSAATDRSTAGGAIGNAACVQAGGTLLPAGAQCATSFKTDVLGAFNTGGCGIVGCHGGQTPASLPRIDPTDVAGMYSEFAAFKLSNGKVYINPCSTDAAQAALATNVNAAAPAETRGVLMPSGSATGLPADVIAKLEAWLKCGSPNN